MVLVLKSVAGIRTHADRVKHKNQVGRLTKDWACIEVIFKLYIGQVKFVQSFIRILAGIISIISNLNYIYVKSQRQPKLGFNSTILQTIVLCTLGFN